MNVTEAQSSGCSEIDAALVNRASPHIQPLQPEACASQPQAPGTEQRTRVLVAGIGNIFFADDAFGVETIAELLRTQLPAGVRAIDFGIRSYDLAYALQDDYEAAILVDATPQGGRPGTVYVLELDPNELAPLPAEAADPHTMNPLRVLQMAHGLGNLPRRVYLVGCEPGCMESIGGEMGLSPEVKSAIPRAVEKIQALLNHLLEIDLEVEEKNQTPDSCRFERRAL